MAEIIIDTDKLRQYATRIANVNLRLSSLDRRLNSLYLQVGMEDGLSGLWNLLQADIITSYSSKLSSCKTYLEKTASDFEAVETVLLKYNPSTFNPVIAALDAAKLVSSGTASTSGGAYARLGYVDEETTVSLNYGKYKDKKILGDEDHLDAQIKQDKISGYQKMKMKSGTRIRNSRYLRCLLRLKRMRVL